MNVDKDKISIVIPIYNTKDYIEATVKSVCNQTYTNLEIVLVDDGSTDGTQNVLMDLGKWDKRIKLIFKKNEGVTKARLRGVLESTGRWIGFVDSDDRIDPTMYETLIVNAKKFEADISHCGYKKIYPDKTEFYYGTQKTIEQDGIQGLKDLMKGDFIEPGLCNKLYKRDLFDTLLQEPMIDFSIKNNEDLLMNFYLFRQARKSIFQDECLYYYCVRNASASTAQLNANILCDPINVRRIIYQKTLGVEELNAIARRNLLVKLINLATRKVGKKAQWMIPYQNEARKELKEFYKINKNKIGKMLKVRALLAIIFPALYRGIHNMIRG